MRIRSLVIAFVLLVSACGPAVNPDPNHTHADFAVWVAGQRLDFTDEPYMSGLSTDENHDNEEGLRKYLHLHDGIDNVVHRHKPGLTLGDFLGTIGLPATPGCITLDDAQFMALDEDLKKDYAFQKRLCDSGKFRWTMVVNGTAKPFDPAYAFADLDKVLLSYSASDTAWQDEWAEMTDEACLYSKTCPERGEPPAENCVSDPAVPCLE